MKVDTEIKRRHTLLQARIANMEKMISAAYTESNNEIMYLWREDIQSLDSLEERIEWLISAANYTGG